MPEFFVYCCRECGARYAGALEEFDHFDTGSNRTGTCSDCLAQMFGMQSNGEEVERRRTNFGTTPNS